MESVAAELTRLEAVVREMPGKLMEAEAIEAKARQTLDDKIAETLAFDPSAEVPPEIAALEAAAAASTIAANRVRGQRAGIARQIDQKAAELESRRAIVADELGQLSTAIRDDLAEKIMLKARELADLYAAYDAFTVANGMPSDWLDLAHVSDPRKAMSLRAPGGGKYDHAPNLLAEPGHENSAAVKAIRPALETMRKARQLVRSKRHAGSAHA